MLTRILLLARPIASLRVQPVVFHHHQRLSLLLENHSARAQLRENLCVAPVRRMSDSECNIPDAAEAQRRVKEFEGVTNTDEAFAQFCLQEHDWDLTRALNSHFSALCDKAEEEKRIKEEEESSQSSEPQKTIDDALREGTLTTRAPESLTMITWNIDGLDKHNLKLRTKAVIRIIKQEKADIVFLQEVIPETFAYIEAALEDYDCIPGDEEQYFVATLLRRGRVYRDNAKVIRFPGSVMGRHLVAVAAHCGQVKLDLLNTHLESTKDHSEERKIQLKRCLDIIQKRPNDRNVILGGDLNLRDQELVGVGGIPPGTYDCWEKCGRRREVEHTWDLTRNSNLEWPHKFRPKMRLDRVYLKGLDGSPGGARAEHFGLIGLQKISGTQSFPSDHWGILVKLQLDQGDSAEAALPPTKKIKMEGN